MRQSAADAGKTVYEHMCFSCAKVSGHAIAAGVGSVEGFAVLSFDERL